MKFFHILLLLLLACSMIFSSKLSKFNRKHGHRILRTRGAWDTVKKVIKGFFDTFGLVEAWEDFQTCKENSGEMDEDEKKKQEKESKKIEESLSPIGQLLTKVVDGICYVKDKISKWLQGIFIKLRRRRIRLFLQGKIRRLRLRGFFSKLWEYLTSGIDKIVGWAQSVAAFVGTAKEKIQELLTDQIKNVVKPVTDAIDKIREKFEIWLSKHPWLLAIYNWIKCIYKTELAGKIKDAITIAYEFVNLVLELVADPSGAGWVRLAMNLICNYRLVGQAITFLRGVFSGDDKEKRPFNLGKFLGYFMQATVEH